MTSCNRMSLLETLGEMACFGQSFPKFSRGEYGLVLEVSSGHSWTRGRANFISIARELVSGWALNRSLPWPENRQQSAQAWIGHARGLRTAPGLCARPVPVVP